MAAPQSRVKVFGKVAFCNGRFFFAFLLVISFNLFTYSLSFLIYRQFGHLKCFRANCVLATCSCALVEATIIGRLTHINIVHILHRMGKIKTTNLIWNVLNWNFFFVKNMFRWHSWCNRSRFVCGRRWRLHSACFCRTRFRDVLILLCRCNIFEMQDKEPFWKCLIVSWRIISFVVVRFELIVFF